MLSGLTVRGRCLLAAGVAAAVCSVALDERDLLRIAAFVVVLPLLAMVVAARVRHGLRVRREVLPGRVQVGAQAEVRLHVTGSGAVPLGGLQLEDEVPHALSSHPYFRVEHVRRAGAVLDYQVTPQLRGIHQIGPLRTRVGDPFGLAEFGHELGGRSRLVAVPRVVPLGGLPAGSGLGTGEDGTTRLRAGHGDDDTMVREYRHGDDIRRVHWKSTAKRDELMVRVEERPWHGGVTVLLDRRTAAHRGSGAASSLEWAVSAAASICAHLHAHDQQVRLITEDGAALAGGPGPFDGGQDDSAMLEALAAVRPSAQRDLVCPQDPGNGQELIAVLGATSTAGVGELTRLRPERARSLALLLDVPAWTGDSDGSFDAQRTAERLRTAGWSVVVVRGPKTSMAGAWGRLCQAGAAEVAS
ncbi:MULTISPECIES: DUF58 domain-containing protein [unclassified Saccharopolyspora]|uniref:DUF58 domain-containing protein n=1 Tax=Saccharopolyspora TaxID=1835 RepID=UPI00190D8C81|nr:DUF58 domain-containing protein [Saccharopolyspora sp. HNM0986]MBK0867328.1 DUF58 domain-containing protein [Saccharopolyspora sp. HNM0986]